MCGENTDNIIGTEFNSTADKIENVIVRNYYLTGVFGEKNLTLYFNLISLAIISIMFGVVLK